MCEILIKHFWIFIGTNQRFLNSPPAYHRDGNWHSPTIDLLVTKKEDERIFLLALSRATSLGSDPPLERPEGEKRTIMKIAPPKDGGRKVNNPMEGMFVGLGSVVFLVIIIGVVISAFSYNARSGVTQLTDPFMDAFNNKDFAAAAERFHAESETKQEDIARQAERIDEALGDYIAHHVDNFSVTPDKTTANVRYLVEYEQGEADLYLTAKSIDGEWALHSFYVQSDRFGEMLRQATADAVQDEDSTTSEPE